MYCSALIDDLYFSDVAGGTYLHSLSFESNPQSYTVVDASLWTYTDSLGNVGQSLPCDSVCCFMRPCSIDRFSSCSPSGAHVLSLSFLAQFVPFDFLQPYCSEIRAARTFIIFSVFAALAATAWSLLDCLSGGFGGTREQSTLRERERVCVLCV